MFTSTPPLIGIPSTRFERKELPELQGTHANYLNAVLNAGALPIIIPFLKQQLHLEEIFAKLDGLLLAGGEDVDPLEYGEKPHEKLGDVIRERDFTELSLTRLAYEKKLPTLGICRGIQVMNVALGGTLYQDLPSQLGVDHTVGMPDRPKDGYDGFHEIKITPTSILHTAIKKEKVIVNSAHHQSIKKLADNLLATAWSNDKFEIIEAVEGLNHPYFLGVQFHPERLVLKEDLWEELFKDFVNQIVIKRSDF